MNYLSTTIKFLYKFFYTIIYLFNSYFWSSDLIGWEPFPAVQYSSDNRTLRTATAHSECHADTQIHYQCINNLFFLMECSFRSFLGENGVV